MLREHAGLGLLTPVFTVAPITHAQLAAAFSRTHAPASAGFCEPLPDGRWRTFGFSDSLCLTPQPGDAQLIEVFVRQTAALGHRTARPDPAAA